jgi:hypothetical protein
MLKNTIIKVSAVTTLALIANLGSTQILADTKKQGFSPYVDEKGNISFPQGFRTSMVHLGSWFVPAGDASGFHDVYTEKESVEAFQKTGEFPDGATLVKELRASKAATYTTGESVSHSTEHLKQWFIMVKTTKQRFKDNPLWGDGWGWALFKPNETSQNLAKNYKTDCLGCHVPAKDKDWVYTEAYPLLKSHK